MYMWIHGHTCVHAKPDLTIPAAHAYEENGFDTLLAARTGKG